MLNETKERLKFSSILISVLLFLFGIIVILIIFTRPMQSKNSAKAIQAVLEQKSENRYTVGKRVFVNAPIAETAFFFEVTDKLDVGKKQYAVLTRLIALNGPVAVVFLGNEENFSFTGIAGVENTQEDAIIYGITASMILHWQENLKKIILEKT